MLSRNKIEAKIDDASTKDFIAFVHEKTRITIDTCGHQMNWLSATINQCFGTRDKKTQADIQKAITSTLGTMYIVDSSCFESYIAQIAQWLHNLEQDAATLYNLDLKCTILQFANDVVLRMQSTFPNVAKHLGTVRGGHLTYDVFIDFISADCVQIEIPKLSKLYRIPISQYQSKIKPLLNECKEEEYLYLLTEENITKLTTTYSVKVCSCLCRHGSQSFQS